MDFLFDHVVHYVKDPYKAMADFSELGFHTTPGGQHDFWGTYNTLCYFDNLSYIEWIGLESLQVAKNAKHPFSEHLLEDYEVGEGLSQIAFRTSDIEKIKQELNRKGLTTIGPLPGSRIRPDGTLLKWSMLFIKHQLPMPFFIQWGQTDAERKQELISNNIVKPQDKKLSEIWYAVTDCEKTASLWGEMFKGRVSDDDDNMGLLKKVELPFIDVYFCEDSDQINSRGQRPYKVGIHPSAGKEVIKYGAIYNI
ncbi:VOC family protein [Fredinandcohnia sp. 179-A 10B2 NHS]|uniref:VOC family protein n=1 Tax=Fredinandcohnia sp. 179-A 10B2 NHS TaxID=3235176 RepID=UPI0039A032D4